MFDSQYTFSPMEGSQLQRLNTPLQAIYLPRLPTERSGGYSRGSRSLRVVAIKPSGQTKSESPSNTWGVVDVHFHLGYLHK